jgi:Xaa-Pro aminopeptidase
MRASLELPRFTIAERDRRWLVVREAMAKRHLDCLVLFGWPYQWDFTIANARYLSQIGGNCEVNVLVFPHSGDPISFIPFFTFVDYWKAAQEWVPDVRVKKGTWAKTLADCLRSLGFEKGRIGVDGLAGPLDPDGWIPHSVFAAFKADLADAELVNIDDMLEQIRTVKSAEEIVFLRRAGELGDLMLAACREEAKPGVPEAAVHASMIRAMLANGGEEPTLFLWACDKNPLPHPFRLPTMRKIDAGDIITCEMHPKYGGYLTHVERTFTLGKAEPDRRRIYEGCLATYRAGMENFGPGRKISSAMQVVKDAIDGEKLGICEAGIHGHGLGSLEYPRFRHHAYEADKAALATMEDAFKPGMVFAFNIDLFDPKWRDGRTGAVFAETVLITEIGAERLHSFPMELQELTA